VQEQRQC